MTERLVVPDTADEVPPMTWDYRVARFERPAPDGEEIEFRIIEAFYRGDSDEVVLWSEDFGAVAAESIEELAADVRRLGAALERPVLNAEDLPS